MSIFDTVKSWYHPGLSKNVAICLLYYNCVQGTYLLRDSQSNPGNFTVSVRTNNSVMHIPLYKESIFYIFGKLKFTTISRLLSHFDHYPIIAGSAGSSTSLKYPYPNNILEPPIYERITLQTEAGTIPSKSPYYLQSFFIGNKESCLMKLGSGWKDEHALEFYDLRDAIEAEWDDTYSKSNSFRIKFPSRTFYFYTTDDDDAKEWVDLIQYKLRYYSEEIQAKKPSQSLVSQASAST
ncbi:Dual adapter for phosphotyrosine and 3-phosphotyrosine and 3-phosphoinositide [Trichoplax sp. H2]|nr:Dual adapter for phosphotyrosine and 3-phosphotyrosine and 3-phosphoinositide [Trichoplax sp. H2]|eukprot:RDD37719.1 Dual adapter for phosphotyrosine and 3-phosphotyrosine and 3-phosphoinositide [Trichoplax sp. H2]